MAGRKLFWQIYPAFLLITLLSLAAVSIYASQSLYRFYLDQVGSDLISRARLLADELESGTALADAAKVDDLCKRLGRNSSVRITVIDPSGRVIGDSMENPALMANHSDRPEVIAALAGQLGRSQRMSPTLKEPMIYAALPLEKGGKVIGVVRTAASLQSISKAVRGIYFKIAFAGLVIALLSGLITLAISRRISRPLEELKRGAEIFARGELGRKLSVAGSEEIAGLVETMNQMAAQLDERIRAISSQRNEQDAILGSMVEGVLAVDSHERLLSVNAAGLRMLGISPELKGRSIQELIRNPALQRLIRKTLTEPGPVEGEIVLEQETSKFLQAHGAIISDARDQGSGAVIVLNDITRLKQLENLRKEFVANVSHELKTPVTALKGFVETLLDGALKNPEDAARFVNIISEQADRQNRIIDDLLLLSRIEQEDEKIGLKLEPARIRPILASAVSALQPAAAGKKIPLELSCPEDLSAKVNADLLEQAVINLVDNALKYSEPGNAVRVEAKKDPGWLVITVEDRGIGIDKAHLSRIFERFYVVDKSRSRKLGGTGLGLAIVKHIARAHQGSVSVESIPGQGSKFSICIPAN